MPGRQMVQVATQTRIGGGFELVDCCTGEDVLHHEEKLLINKANLKYKL